MLLTPAQRRFVLLYLSAFLLIPFIAVAFVVPAGWVAVAGWLVLLAFVGRRGRWNLHTH